MQIVIHTPNSSVAIQMNNRIVNDSDHGSGAGMAGSSFSTEHQLFQLISKGDKDAFHELFKMYTSYITAIIKKVLGRNTSTEDILQEVFLKIWLKRESLTTVNNPKAWIAKVTCYICYNRLRQEKINETATSQIKYTSIEHCNTVEENINYTETVGNLSKAIKMLPPKTQQIYKLNKEHGMRIADIADQMQLSPQTVKNTLGTALKKVKSFLKQQGITS